MPKISVLIPTYNNEIYIADSIKSVVNQTFQDFEIIVLDNCSTDNTEKVVREFLGDGRITYSVNEVNRGSIANFNKGLSLAKGEYIKFLFSDDLLMPEALEEMAETLDENPVVSLVTSYKQLFGASDALLKQPLQEEIAGYEAIKSTVTSFNWIGTPTNVMFRKADADGLEFTEDWQWWTDLHFWHRLLEKGNLYVIPKVLSKLRERETSLTNACISSYKNYYDEYYYLKNIRDKNLFAPLKDDDEFKFVLRQNAKKWINLMRGFIRTGNYKFLKKALTAIKEENLMKESLVRTFKKLPEKINGVRTK